MRDFFQQTKKASKVLLLSATFLCAQTNSEPTLSGDTLAWNQATETLEARGNARLQNDKILVEADSIHWAQEDQQAKVQGNVRVNQRGGVRLLADELHYQGNPSNREVLSGHPILIGQPPFYLYTPKVTGSFDNLSIQNPTLYIGEPEPFGINIYSKTARLIRTANSENPGKVDSKVCLKHSVVRIGKLPLIYIPSYTHNFQTLPFSFDFDLGNSTPLGSYIRTNLLLTHNPNLFWGFNLDHYSKRGPLFGPVFNYQAGDPEDCGAPYVQGNFVSGYINDKEPRGHDVRGKNIPKKRHFVNWQHKQRVNQHLSLTHQVNHWRDSEVVRDFRPKYFNHDQDPDNFAEWVYQGPYTVISAFTRFQANHFQRVQERLPELGIEMLPNLVFEGPLIQKGFFRAVHLKETDPLGNNKPKSSDRLDFFYDLRMPYQPARGIILTPILSTRVNHYVNNSATDRSFTTGQAQIGADLELNFYGQWDYRNPFWGIKGLRHQVRPILQYRYLPIHSWGKPGISPIERNFFSTTLPSIDLSYLRERDAAKQSHLVRLGLENILQTRNACEPLLSKDLASLNLYQDINIHRPSNKHRFSDFFFDFGLMPFYWFEYNLLGRLDSNTLTVQELRNRLKIIDGRYWELYFTTDSIHRKTNQYYLDLVVRPNPEVTLTGSWRYDHKASQIISQSYGISRKLSNSWILDTKVTYHPSNKQKGPWEFAILLTWLPINTNLADLKL